MLAITVTPGARGHAELAQFEEPVGEGAGLVVETLALGVCGTDREILAGRYGSVPVADVTEYLDILSRAKVVSWR